MLKTRSGSGLELEGFCFFPRKRPAKSAFPGEEIEKIDFWIANVPIANERKMGGKRIYKATLQSLNSRFESWSQ